MRDKSISLFRGKGCSLPAIDWSPTASKQMYSSSEVAVQARIELAQLQEQIYLLLYSNEATRQPASQQIPYINVLNDKLRQWAKVNGSIFSEQICTTTDLHLTFCSTRIMALRPSHDPKHRERVLQDSKITCRFLAAINRRNGSLPSVMPLHR